MAGKFKRTVIGSVCKPKEAGKPDYIKVRDDVTLKKGSILRLESKKSRLEDLDRAGARVSRRAGAGRAVPRDPV